MVQAALPTGDNSSSICIRTDNWHTDVFTRPVFQAIKYRDIITLVEFIENKSFPQAMKRICSICGFDYYNDVVVEVPKLLQWLDFVEKGCNSNHNEECKLSPLPEEVLNSFYQNPVQKWLDEQITYESQVEWEIGFDIASERITIPIRDELGLLVGIKGRKISDENIDNDKYLYLYPCSKSKLLFGLHKNYQDIKNKNECILVESEKSVIKLWGYGYKNCVSIGGKSLSKRQAEMLLRLNVPITIALDEGVTDEEIDIMVKELQYPISMNQIYVIKDTMEFLEEKNSPSDDMNIFKILYDNYKILYY